MAMRNWTPRLVRAAAAASVVAGLSMVAGCTPARETIMVRSSAAPAAASNDAAVADSGTTTQPVYRFGAGDGVGQSNYRIYRDEVLNADQAN